VNVLPSKVPSPLAGSYPTVASYLGTPSEPTLMANHSGTTTPPRASAIPAVGPCHPRRGPESRLPRAANAQVPARPSRRTEAMDGS
jgi:hypothetical protein